MKSAVIISTLATLAAAAHEKGTFAVLRFNGNKPLTEGRMDPVVNPGTASKHYHMIQGGDAFSLNVKGDQLLKNGKCTTAKIARDFSNYWVPTLFFSKDGKFQKVPMFYMNVYYFFDKTHDDLVAFPPGLKMLTGDADKRSPPAGPGIQLDPSKPGFNNIQFTCPSDNYNAPAYPAGSDGSSAGIADPLNKGAGVGFPTKKCNGYASPLRQDLHFPSCYNPAAGLDDYKNNMVFPADAGNGYRDCPKGHIHVPHLFYEVYWDTPKFDNQWTEDGKTQPFVFSNGDVTGFSSHADFISGWDTHTLQTIIDTCSAGTLGMDTCPQIPGGLSTDNDCTIAPQIVEPVNFMTASLFQKFDALPNSLSLSGWTMGDNVEGGNDSPAAPAPVPTSTKPYAASPPVPTGLPTGIPSAPIFVENPVVSPAPIAEVPTQGHAPVYPVEDNDASTYWDVVTVTATTTQYVEATPAPQRRGQHGHVARHKHNGFAARR
ncbi:DUF1996 domain-containing protein [Microdochium nivale]|nr:DUF1996 domain-containing protein [Microdochium nivale]